MKAHLTLAALSALAVHAAGQQHAGSVSPADAQRGWRLYNAHCSPCHGADGDLVANADLRRGQFRRGSSDEDMSRTITQGIPGTAMVPIKLTADEVTAVISYLRFVRATPGAAGGDRERGRQLFEGRGGCPDCHRVNGRGSVRAPDLSDVGAIRAQDALERSLLAPDFVVLPQHRFIRAVTLRGRVVIGRRLNEDTYTVQLIDGQERLVSLAKAGLREYTVLKASPMPSFRDKLTPLDRADIVAYLASLRGKP